MMSAGLQLAQHNPMEFSDWRVFAGIAFAVMWVIGQAIAAANKKREDRELAQRRAERERNRESSAGSQSASTTSSKIPPPPRPPMPPRTESDSTARPREPAPARPVPTASAPSPRNQQQPQRQAPTGTPQRAAPRGAPSAPARNQTRSAPGTTSRAERRSAAADADALISSGIELLPENPDALTSVVTRRKGIDLPPSRIVATARNPESVRMGIVMAEVLGAPLALRDSQF